jgi:glycosyltransferase involved in cell wall biosynthesis
MNIAWFDSTYGTHKIDKLREALVGLGHRVNVSSTFSKDVVGKSDVVWVEHLTRNAADVTNHEINKPVVVRLSAMELYKQKMSYLNWQRMSKLVVQGEHLRSYFLERFKKLPANDVVVIGGGIDTDKFAFGCSGSGNKVAVVSEVHWRKGVQQIPGVLKILPEDFRIYPIGQIVNWDCKNYLDWKLKEENLQSRYVYQGTIGDVNKWLKDKNYLLHCSYTEGLPRAVGEGMSVGLKPLIYNYRGAKQQWPKQYVWDNVKDIKEMLKSHNPKEYRGFILNNRSIEHTANEVEKLLKSL